MISNYCKPEDSDSHRARLTLPRFGIERERHAAAVAADHDTMLHLAPSLEAKDDAVCQALDQGIQGKALIDELRKLDGLIDPAVLLSPGYARETQAFFSYLKQVLAAAGVDIGTGTGTETGIVEDGEHAPMHTHTSDTLSVIKTVWPDRYIELVGEVDKEGDLDGKAWTNGKACADGEGVREDNVDDDFDPSNKSVDAKAAIVCIDPKCQMIEEEINYILKSEDNDGHGKRHRRRAQQKDGHKSHREKAFRDDEDVTASVVGVHDDDNGDDDNGDDDIQRELQYLRAYSQDVRVEDDTMNIMGGNRQQHAVLTSLAADIRDNNPIADRRQLDAQENTDANATKVSCCGTFTRWTCFVDKTMESEVFCVVQKHRVHLLHCSTDAVARILHFLGIPSVNRRKSIEISE